MTPPPDPQDQQLAETVAARIRECLVDYPPDTEYDLCFDLETEFAAVRAESAARIAELEQENSRYHRDSANENVRRLTLEQDARGATSAG